MVLSLRPSRDHAEIRIVLLRFVLSLVSFAIITYVSKVYLEGDLGSDLLSSQEDKEQRKDARITLDRLANEFPKLRDIQLNSHELIAVSAMVRPTTGFDVIGGHKKLKRELMLHVIVPLQRPELFFRNKALRPPTGILLEGAPGTGKTMLANAIAAEAKLPMLCIRPSMVEQKYHGESEKVVRGVFTAAKRLAPCVVFIDEIDGLVRNRSFMDSEANYSIKTELLQQLDSVGSNTDTPIIVVAATNYAKGLDKALYRRLPRTYTVPLPDETARIEILRKLTTHEPRRPPKHIATECTGFSGSDLHNLYQMAASMRNEMLAANIVAAQHAGDDITSIKPITVSQWKKALIRTRESMVIRG
jgi:SpoVK/Ycf46/Vps4 family AAA+-type ATPase